MKFRKNPFAFILDQMREIENSGDSYTDDDKLYARCKLKNEYLTYRSFLQGKHELIRMGYLAVEGKRLYSKRTLNYENTCASRLAEILPDNDTNTPELPDELCAGNVLWNLLALGTPNILLRTQYRQDAEAKALSYNVHQFASIQSVDDLQFDDSFVLKETPEDQEIDAICELAEIGMLGCQDVRILAPTKDLVADINKKMQQTMNPPDSDKQEFGSLREGDTVMILKNNAKHHCYNGDIGALHFDEDLWGKHYAEVQLPDGRYPCFAYCEARDYLTLSYACTVHKAQGGQAETVIVYMGKKGKRLRKRNLLYTAISRATSQVIIVGNRAAVDDALKNQPEPRKSMLVAKTNQVRRGWNRTA